MNLKQKNVKTIYQLWKLNFLRWCAKSCLFLGEGGLLIWGHIKNMVLLNQFGYIERSHNPCFC